MAASHIPLVTFLVRDYAEASNWFQSALGFSVLEDTDMGEGKRWVVVGPASGHGVKLLLALAATPEQQAHVGKAAGGRVAYFLYTVEFDTMAARMRGTGVEFLETPRHEPYGTVAVFADLYGNKWDLLQPIG